MAYLPLAGTKTAIGRAREVLEQTEKKWGYVPNIVRALALRPEILDAEDHWTQALMHSGTLPRDLKEAVATAVSAVNSCDYCATSHAHQASVHGVSEKNVAACRLLDFRAFDARSRAALDFARKAATDMRQVRKSDVDALRKYFRPDQIVELTLVVASFAMYNTFVTVLGIELENGDPVASGRTQV